MLFDNVKSLIILGCLSAGFSTACKEPEFKATSGGAQAPVQQPPNSGNNIPTRPEELPNLNQNNASSQDSTNASAGCIKNQNSRYNIVFVFDQSGSQSSTDPERIRGSAASSFVQRMTDPSKVKGEVYVNMLGFDKVARPGPGGWTKLEPNTLSTVMNNISQTTPPPQALAGTHYGPALTMAQQMLSQQPLQDTHRNFVVFLTDGKPNDGGKYSQVLQQLVSTNRATMITVASGSGVKADGEETVRAMALPQTSQPNQIAGIYQRARQASDLGSVFDQIFASITNCN